MYKFLNQLASKMARQKSLSSSLLSKTPKSQLIAQQPSTTTSAKMLESSKKEKRYSTSKDKKTQDRKRRGKVMITVKPNSISARWYNYFPQTGEKKKNTTSGSSGEYHFTPQDLAHPTSYMLQCWEYLIQNNQQGRNHSPIHQHTGFLSTALPTKGLDPALPASGQEQKILPPGSLCKPLRLK